MAASLVLWLLSAAAPVAGSPGTDGLQTIRLENPHGTITTYLPADLTAGDTISGTVSLDPAGDGEQRREKNRKRLATLSLEFGDTRVAVGDGGPLTAVVPDSDSAVLRLLGADGWALDQAPVDVRRAPAEGEAAADAFVVPPLGQAGKPLRIEGPFDGDFASTDCRFDGEPLTPLAESPRTAVFTAPPTQVGAGRLELREGSHTVTAEYRNLSVHLSAGDLDLKPGQRTRLTVTVSGLEGVQEAIPLALVNRSPAVVALEGGDEQSIQIDPATVSPEGTFDWSCGVTGANRGAWEVNASVVTPPGAPIFIDNRPAQPAPLAAGDRDADPCQQLQELSERLQEAKKRLLEAEQQTRAAEQKADAAAREGTAEGPDDAYRQRLADEREAARKAWDAARLELQKLEQQLRELTQPIQETEDPELRKLREDIYREKIKELERKVAEAKDKVDRLRRELDRTDQRKRNPNAAFAEDQEEQRRQAAATARQEAEEVRRKQQQAETEVRKLDAEAARLEDECTRWRAQQANRCKPEGAKRTVALERGPRKTFLVVDELNLPAVTEATGIGTYGSGGVLTYIAKGVESLSQEAQKFLTQLSFLRKGPSAPVAVALRTFLEVTETGGRGSAAIFGAGEAMAESRKQFFDPVSINVAYRRVELVCVREQECVDGQWVDRGCKLAERKLESNTRSFRGPPGTTLMTAAEINRVFQNARDFVAGAADSAQLAAEREKLAAECKANCG